MNTVDIPGLVIAVPIIVIKSRYWGTPFERRGPWAKRLESWLIVGLLIFISVRLFTKFGVVRF